MKKWINILGRLRTKVENPWLVYACCGYRVVQSPSVKTPRAKSSCFNRPRGFVKEFRKRNISTDDKILCRKLCKIKVDNDRRFAVAQQNKSKMLIFQSFHAHLTIV